MWREWINGILALWLIVSAFIGLSASTQFWNLLIVGAVIAVLAFWDASERSAGSMQLT